MAFELNDYVEHRLGPRSTPASMLMSKDLPPKHWCSVLILVSSVGISSGCLRRPDTNGRSSFQLKRGSDQRFPDRVLRITAKSGNAPHLKLVAACVAPVAERYP